MKGKLLAIVCVLVVMACIASGTVAYYTKEATATNVITTGEVNLEIVETTKDKANISDSGIVVLPGATVSKIVSVKNTSKHPMYVKVQLSKFVSDVQLQQEFMNNKILTTDFNGADWTVGEDGFVYYNKVLEAGEETTPIFNEVYINGPKTGNQYRGLNFTLQVDAYGVQSENNGSKVSDAAGWPEASSANKSAVFVPNIPS